MDSKGDATKQVDNWAESCDKMNYALSAKCKWLSEKLKKKVLMLDAKVHCFPQPVEKETVAKAKRLKLKNTVISIYIDIVLHDFHTEN